LLDIKWIRENQDAFVKGLADRGSPEPRETLNQILKLDEQRRISRGGTSPPPFEGRPGKPQDGPRQA
jgi:hypothetical protein